MQTSAVPVQPDKTGWSAAAHALKATETERLEAEALLSEWQQRGHIRKTCREMLSLSDGTIASFYAGLSHSASAEGIAAKSADSGWMAAADFCFVNARATGMTDAPGNFLQAAKLLPALRVSAIHLAPFLSYERQCIYLQRAERTVDPRLLHKELSAGGIKPEAQLSAFVEACHLLGKACGFDLEPHQTQFSRGVLEHPELFRWAEFREGKLAEGRTMEENNAPEVQARIVEKVKAVTLQALVKCRLDTLEETPSDSPALRATKHETWLSTLHRLIAEGLWTLPCASWDGVGVPRFDRWDADGNYPRFDHRNAAGEDRFTQSHRALTPVKFAENLPVNRLPAPGEVTHHDAGAEHLASIFVYWRDLAGFDFVRYDSFDHVFDSVLPDGTAISDRPTLQALVKLNSAVRKDKPGTGILAERMGNEIGLYAGTGCDLTLGDAMLRRIDGPHMQDSFSLGAEIARLNEGRSTGAPFDRLGTNVSVCFATDTHDTGNPYLWGEPLVKIAGFDRMLLRHFVSRFLGAGASRRPKYEAMGSQDLSHGLYRVNVKDQNLEWVGDKTFNERYHEIEDAWENLRDFLEKGKLTDFHVNGRVAWWVIEQAGARLAAVASLETAEGFDCGGFSAPLKGAGNLRTVIGSKRCVWKAEGDGVAVEHLDYLGWLLLKWID